MEPEYNDPRSASAQKLFPQPQRAGDRRERELRALAREGMPVIFESKWKSSIGPLTIWLHSGRWSNRKTGRSGKINSLSMRVLIKQVL